MIYVNVNAEAVVVGREIQDMQLSIEELERSITDKESQIAYITSAVEMERRALEMNFQPVDPGVASFIVIPGYAAAIAGDVEEELPGWKITVGPREAAHIPGFLKAM